MIKELNMSTRGTVFTKQGPKYIGIYNHFDSYPDGLGQTLLSNYDDLPKVLELIYHGDASSIEKSIEDSVFYHRDRGDKLVIGEAGSIQDFVYNYYFDPELEIWEIM
jgi:hypothetical protein